MDALAWLIVLGMVFPFVVIAVSLAYIIGVTAYEMWTDGD